MLRAGDSFGRYTIEAPLGEGGMGQVYRAIDARLERRVALKVLHPSAGETASAARLLREARAAAALNHPNVVSIFDVGEVDDVPFIAMELIEGRSLREFVGDAAVTVARRVGWLVDVARALSAAHRRGLVHRDIKPENVMVRDEGGAVKVLDFGIARRAQAPVDPDAPTQQPGGSTLTREGAMAGTPLYMAPEQLRGDALDGRTDQFAWGTMAYELLSSRHPWDASDMMKLAAQIASHEPPPLADVAPWVSRRVSDVVARAMSKAPDARFATMEELIAALEAETRREVPEKASSVSLAATEKSAIAPIVPARTTGAIVAPVDTGPTGTRPTGAGPRRSSPVLALAAAAVAIGAVVAAVRWSGKRSSSSSPTSSTSSTSSTPSTSASSFAVTDLAAPSSSNVAASTEYRGALQAYRDGKWRETFRLFAHAAEQDPSMAAAQMRAAWLTLLYGGEPGAKYLHGAQTQRAALGPRDAAMLDALAPLFLAPPALKDALARANAALVIAPGDAELHLVRGWILGELGEWSNAEGAIDDSLKHDPRFGAAWSFRGTLLARQGKHAEAIAAWDRCIAISANATACLRGREGVHEIDGQCAAAEPDLRTLLSLEDAEPSWYFRLAKVLFAQGRPREGVEAAIAQLQQHLPPSARKEDAPLRLHESYGEFELASTLLDSLDAQVTTSNEDSAHGGMLAMRSFLTEEIGHPERSIAEADSYLKQRSAWTPPDDALTFEPIAWNALRLAGKLDSIELAKKRKAWLEADAAAVASGGLSKERTFYAWIVGWAWTAQTPDEAKAAMEAMPRPPPPIWDLDWSMVQGRTLLLAGRIDDALAVLRPLARSCRALEGPIEQTRGVDLLGRALEASGDTKGACAAYATVLDRWGAAKPKSITADHARARVAALKCP